MKTLLKERIIGIKGAGEIASGIAHSLHRANFKKLFMMETAQPLAVRRHVSFCSAIQQGEITVEGVQATLVETMAEMRHAWEEDKIPVMVDPQWRMIQRMKPDVVIDAVLAKKNLGTSLNEASLVIGLGPGFTAGEDVQVLIETNRGHNLGRHIFSGPAQENTGVPGNIGGFTAQRVLRSPGTGCFTACKKIGDRILRDESVGAVDGHEIRAEIDGVIRGLIMSGTPVSTGLKMGDIDPRGDVEYCRTISDKARAVGGSVLTAVLMRFNT